MRYTFAIFKTSSELIRFRFLRAQGIESENMPLPESFSCNVDTINSNTAAVPSFVKFSKSTWEKAQLDYPLTDHQKHKNQCPMCRHMNGLALVIGREDGQVRPEGNPMPCPHYVMFPMSQKEEAF
jgi:hypothetical protein